jgi:hypothetical protein
MENGVLERVAVNSPNLDFPYRFYRLCSVVVVQQGQSTKWLANCKPGSSLPIDF